jgi:hypothetical protein
VKWEHKLDTELDGSMLFNDIYRITNDTKLRNFQFKLLHHILPNNKLFQSIYNSEYNFLPQGIKMEQFFARSFHLKKYLKLFLSGLIQKLLNLNLMKARFENKMYKHDNKWCYIHELNL